MFLFDNDYLNLTALVLTIGAAAIICFKYETRNFRDKSSNYKKYTKK